MNKVKAFITTVVSTLAGWLGVLAIPIFALVICNLVDYGTGLAASKYRNQKVNSYKSFRGICKKVCMWLLILIGALLDWLIKSTLHNMGITLPFDFLISIVVAVWLICNEIISILENMVDIGVDLPPFLAPIVKNIKSQVERSVNNEQN